MNNPPSGPTPLDPALSTEGLVELDKVIVSSHLSATFMIFFGFYFVDKVLGESCKGEVLVEQR